MGIVVFVYRNDTSYRGYYVDTTGKSTKRIAEYIQNQLKEDQVSEQMTLKEYEDPFMGSK